MPSASPQRLATRAQSVRSALDECRIDALLVTHVPNVTYLSNLGASAAVALVTQDALHVITDSRYLAHAEGLFASSGSGVELVPVRRTYEETITDLLRRLKLRRLGFEAAHLTVRRHAGFVDSLPGVTLVATDRVVEQRRLVKDPDEIATLRTAGGLLAGLAPLVTELVRAGAREADVAGDIDRLIRRAGFDRPAFDTIVASGPNSALPHARAGQRRIEANEPVVLDFGGVYDGYCVDFTRTVVSGSAVPEVARAIEAVKAAQAAAVMAVRPGALAGDIDSAARAVLGAHGFPDPYRHGTGHGLGLELHEEPRISDSAPEQVLAPGMIFTVEPGAYFPGRFGIRIEDDVLVTVNGYEVLTGSDRVSGAAPGGHRPSGSSRSSAQRRRKDLTR